MYLFARKVKAPYISCIEIETVTNKEIGIMEVLKYSEIENIQVDDGMSDDYSHHIDNAITEGFDENYPIIVDEDGLILDGNHRFTAFQTEDRLDELVFIVVYYNDFVQAEVRTRESGKNEEFLHNDDYFYSIMKSIAQ